MPRSQAPVRPIAIDYICDECGKGNYRSTDRILMSDPAQFPHECDECGHQQTFIEKYPLIRYAKEGELIDLDNYTQQPL